MKRSIGRTISIGIGGTLLGVFLAGCQTMEHWQETMAKQWHEITDKQRIWDGLELRQVKGIDAFYVLPDSEIKAYNSVMIDPVQVVFDKGWNAKNAPKYEHSERLTTKVVEKIRAEMASSVREIFAKVLQEGGYKLVEQASSDTLQVTPGLANVYIRDPVTWVSFPSEAMLRMTLLMELRDGATGQVVGRVVDQKGVDDFDRKQVTDSVANSSEFGRVVSNWADRLRQGLDKARAEVVPRS